MDLEKVFCACGCGEEVQRWKNGICSPFRRGHHMRKEMGYKPPIQEPKFCECGCHAEIVPLKNGHVGRFIKGHHLKGKSLSMDYRLERTRRRWNREPVLSPYIPDTFVCFNPKAERWMASFETISGKGRNSLHANAVYRYCRGNIPEGYVVHHKNGRADRLEDDRPDNLMLLLDEWNLRFFPVLAKGFGVPEQIVTNLYLNTNQEASKEDIFSELCSLLINLKKDQDKEWLTISG
jgi:hypothetical protein